ncbi:MAG: response regulator [Nitrospirae bacterium]|nr:response regulator [Nitrospirota bacterium]
MKQSILIIEGNEIKKKILKDFFWFYGYDALCVDSIDEAISSLQTRGFSLLIVDYHLSGMNWSAFIETIRSTYPNMPIIGMCRKEAEFRDLGIRKVISSPFDLKGLMDEVGFLLNTPRPHP